MLHRRHQWVKVLSPNGRIANVNWAPVYVKHTIMHPARMCIEMRTHARTHARTHRHTKGCRQSRARAYMHTQKVQEVKERQRDTSIGWARYRASAPFKKPKSGASHRSVFRQREARDCAWSFGALHKLILMMVMVVMMVTVMLYPYSKDTMRCVQHRTPRSQGIYGTRA